MQANGTTDIASNGYLDRMVEVRAPRIATMKGRTSTCFDGQFYRTSNADLGGLPDDDLWPHFVKYGQFQGRAYRCCAYASAELCPSIDTLCRYNIRKSFACCH